MTGVNKGAVKPTFGAAPTWPSPESHSNNRPLCLETWRGPMNIDVWEEILTRPYSLCTSSILNSSHVRSVHCLHVKTSACYSRLRKHWPCAALEVLWCRAVSLVINLVILNNTIHFVPKDMCKSNLHSRHICCAVWERENTIFPCCSPGFDWKVCFSTFLYLPSLVRCLSLVHTLLEGGGESSSINVCLSLHNFNPIIWLYDKAAFLTLLLLIFDLLSWATKTVKLASHRLHENDLLVTRAFVRQRTEDVARM